MDLISKYLQVVDSSDPIKYTGRVVKVQGLLIESRGPQAVVGELCQILVPRLNTSIWAEVAGIRGEMVQLMAYSRLDGLEAGCVVVAIGEMLRIPVSDKLLGRSLDCMGHPNDGGGDIASSRYYPAIASPPDAMTRRLITRQISTGVRAIDGLLPLGKGQRIGIFAGSGVGKSTIIGMMARNSNADVNVIALIGERGREVREFIENDLGKEGLAKSVLVVSTSDTPPLARLRAAYVATAVAEYFRDRGQDVLLLFDSVTRFARAQREIGLAIGEPPTTRGYTPSVFDSLPKLLERSGSSSKGSITGIYTILVDGDDMDEPISDTVRGTLDGHVVLSRRLAEAHRYPAVDVLKSISRLSYAVSGPVTQKAMAIIRHHMAVYEESEDMINIGAYVKGSNPAIDAAILKRADIVDFLIQAVTEKAPLMDSIKKLGEIAGLDIPHSELEKLAATKP
ncbi:flagellar protein export ATPase FliI [Spirochaetota bacterium]